LIIEAHRQMEGAGFEVRRPFPGQLRPEMTDPFLLLDEGGPSEYGPGEAKGAPWHPHRGFETVTYVVDGAIAHHDSTGGGGLITDGDTQWMTAGAGILHDEMPSDDVLRQGGLMHIFQLWVNLPARLKMTPPRYQDIGRDSVRLITSEDGGSLLRLIAGRLGDYEGPGNTWTPITYAHATVSAGARLQVPWRADFNALAYVFAGKGTAGPEQRPVQEGNLVVFGPGNALELTAARGQDERSGTLEVLLIGGQPIGEPVVFYGPFVMNTDAEIRQALLDYRAGRLGQIPAARL
jgi:redox-sensitive bicupin YhaK (pirin superfamily)